MDYFGMRSTYGAEWEDAFTSGLSLRELASEYTHLTRKGDEYVGRCPFPDHSDSTPSFSVNEQKGVFNCFGCGRGGNTISFVQQITGASYIEACRELHDGGELRSAGTSTPRDDEAAKRRCALSIWNNSFPIEGTPAAAYFDSRSIPFEFASQQENIRFSELSFQRSARKHPAIVAAARNVNGEIVSIQRIYLTTAGEKMAKDCKRTLGSTGGAAIRLRGIDAPLGDPKHIYLCEGLEDGLSIARYYSNAEVWVTMGTSNLASVILPTSCKAVTLAHDNDDPGRKAADVASERYVKQGVEVHREPPPEAFKDWNEFLVRWERSSDVYGNALPWLYIDPLDPEVSEDNRGLPTLAELTNDDRF